MDASGMQAQDHRPKTRVLVCMEDVPSKRPDVSSRRLFPPRTVSTRYGSGPLIGD